MKTRPADKIAGIIAAMLLAGAAAQAQFAWDYQTVTIDDRITTVYGDYNVGRLYHGYVDHYERRPVEQ
jgi:hypothetical protein